MLKCLMFDEQTDLNEDCAEPPNIQPKSTQVSPRNTSCLLVRTYHYNLCMCIPACMCVPVYMCVPVCMCLPVCEQVAFLYLPSSPCWAYEHAVPGKTWCVYQPHSRWTSADSTGTGHNLETKQVVRKYAENCIYFKTATVAQILHMDNLKLCCIRKIWQLFFFFFLLLQL